jgi:hypothetical protein
MKGAPVKMSTFVSTIRIAFGCVIVAATGCQLTPNFRTGYQFDAQRLRNEPLGATLAVAQFQDARPPRVYSTTGKLFLTYVPILPYVSMPFERLEESVAIQSDSIARGGRGITLGARQNVAPEAAEYAYPASFARAVADDLKASGLFRDVVYTGAGSAQGHRYLLTGTLRASPLRRSVTSYCLGMPGVLLWFLPIPMAKTSASVTLDLNLVDTQDGVVVWQHTIDKPKVSRLITLYTSSAMIYGRGGAFSFNLEPPPGNAQVDRRSLFSWHFESLRRGMQEAKPSLAQALGTRN